MKKSKLIQVVAVLSLTVIIFGSCAARKKSNYGCPSHIIERVINLF